jgi:hypothetical protein
MVDNLFLVGTKPVVSEIFPQDLMGIHLNQPAETYWSLPNIIFSFEALFRYKLLTDIFFMEISSAIQ